MRRRFAYVTMAGVAMLGLTGALSPALASAGSPTRQVSQGDPYASCSIGAGTGTTVYPSSEVEPSVTVDPHDAGHVVGGFQQDRWNDGGAKGIAGIYSYDGRHFGETELPFSECAPGGVPYQRASDIWFSYGPDGVVYANAIVFDETTARSGVAAATSFDGGRTWHFTQSVINDDSTANFNDKNSITADPTRPGTAYQVWDRFNTTTATSQAPTELSVTHDHGRTWSTPRPIVTGPADGDWQTIDNIIVVDPRNGTLYDAFDWITFTDVTTNNASEVHLGIVKSTDGGRTWSQQTKIATDTSTVDVDPNVPTQTLRTGGLPAIAIDPGTGELYVVDESTDFTNGAYDQIVLWDSTDGGATWSAGTRISQSLAPAFTPSIAVDRRGSVAVTYYDLRYLPANDTTTLPTATWLLTFPRGGAAYPTERQIAPLFDWLQAPEAGGHFLGDYEGLASSGTVVWPLFATTANAPADPTDVFSGAFPLGGHGAAATAPTAMATRVVPHRGNAVVLARGHRVD